MNTYLICGLGNPGEKYARTRHNIGFGAIHEIFHEGDYDTPKEVSKFDSMITEKSNGENKVLLVKPLTYMNNSGRAIQKIKSFYKIPNENILVLYDDIDLPLGDIRIRAKGGAGTHNGIKSIIESLGTQDFARVRLGIGQPYPPQKDLSTFVLEPFTKTEIEKVKEQLQKVPKIINEWLEKGIELTMTNWN